MLAGLREKFCDIINYNHEMDILDIIVDDASRVEEVNARKE